MVNVQLAGSPRVATFTELVVEDGRYRSPLAALGNGGRFYL